MKKQTAQRMYNRALYYLQRFSATEAHLAEVLQRQLQRKEFKGEEIPPEAYKQWIPDTVTKCVALGLVNDRAFAESRLVTLRRQGRSQSYMKQHMAQKGVPKALIAEMLAEEPEENEEEAARRFVERKRLGCALSPEGRDKDLAKLMRAGFRYDIARRALKDAENK